MTFHAHFNFLVGPEAHTIEQARQFVKLSLKAGALGRRNESVIGVEECQ